MRASKRRRRNDALAAKDDRPDYAAIYRESQRIYKDKLARALSQLGEVVEEGPLLTRVRFSLSGASPEDVFIVERHADDLPFLVTCLGEEHAIAAVVDAVRAMKSGPESHLFYAQDQLVASTSSTLDDGDVGA